MCCKHQNKKKLSPQASQWKNSIKMYYSFRLTKREPCWFRCHHHPLPTVCVGDQFKCRSFRHDMSHDARHAKVLESCHHVCVVQKHAQRYNRAHFSRYCYVFIFRSINTARKQFSQIPHQAGDDSSSRFAVLFARDDRIVQINVCTCVRVCLCFYSQHP